MNYLDFLETNVRAVPDQVAIREGERTWTYADLLDDVRAAANVLADAGVDADGTVALVLPNTYHFVTATLGTLARRAIVVPVNTRFSRREIAHIVAQVDPDAVVVADDDAAAVGAALEDADAADATRFAVGEAGGDARDWEATLGRAAPDYVVPETMGEREAFVLHTSGSTGRPKGAVHTHANLIAIADASIASYEMGPGSVFLAVMPLYHCTGIGTILGATLKVGGELLLYEAWDPLALLEAVERHGVNVFSGVPAMFKDWLAEASVADVDTASMRTGVIGGAGVSTDLIERSEALLGCPVLNGWGMTETFAGGLWEDRRGERRLPSVGRPAGRLFETKVVDRQTGSECPPGEPGELLVRGEAMMTGYLDHEAETTGEWFHTGDFARVEDGYVYVLDRVDYTIITGGENVYPQEIEGVIEELEGVREAAVVGRPDERKGEKPVAFVDADPEGGPTAEQVRDHVLANLAAFKHPREVFLVDELERNSVGKVDRAALEDRL